MTRRIIFDRTSCTLAFILAAVAPIRAQTPTPPRATILLDPAHGAADPGSRLSTDVLEKNVNLALATRLRTLLAAQGFNVVLTRETDPDAAISADQRAETANHAHPIACLILHATNAGRGIHLFTSTLIPLTLVDEIKPVLPWETAQARSVQQSLRLVNELASSFHSAHTPLLIGRASVPPIDSFACPAVAVELAPLANPNAEPTPVTDPTYQQGVADAIAGALVSWRQHADQVPTVAPAPGPTR